MNRIVLIIVAYLLFCVAYTSAQIGIDTNKPAPSAALDINAINNNRGLLIPRMTTAQKVAIANPAPSLLVYDIDCNCISQYKDTPSNPGVFAWTCITLFNRHFMYMPSINIPTSDGSGGLLAGTCVIDLYDAYKKGFDTPLVKSAGAIASIPYFERDQFYYYVTYYDTCITVTGISDMGVLNYTVNSLPNYDAFINIVFVLR